METQKNEKVERVLKIYTKLLNGNLVSRSEEAVNHGVDKRSIQRDMDDIRNFLSMEQAENGYSYSVMYDRVQKGYRMKRDQQAQFTGGELLALCKLLLGSRAFAKNELNELVEKLVLQCGSQSEQAALKELIGNELFHYDELQHSPQFMDTVWVLGKAIKESRCIEFCYGTGEENGRMQKGNPVAILFSDRYFYLAVFGKTEPAEEERECRECTVPELFRIDLIWNLNILEERFYIPYSKRFEEGVFRKENLTKM